jgi:fructoselysine-6-P-deglycase FrlB-like protein
MGMPYANEVAQLRATMDWAMSSNVDSLVAALQTAWSLPLVAVGSGGSLSAAHALVGYHRRFTGKLAAVLTPLEASTVHLDSAYSYWLLSASGNNVDIVSALRSLVLREPRQLVAMIGRETSRAGDIAASHSYVDLLLHEPPIRKDGFLATNSLLGFASLLARGYLTAIKDDPAVQSLKMRMLELTSATSATQTEWRDAIEPLWERPTTVILHSPDTALGAIDLESKFTEAALGHVQTADFRNFAHGRHHWLAKRGESSSIVALVDPSSAEIARRTLQLIPPSVPRVRIDLDGSPVESSLASLVSAILIAGWAGRARGIDPGDPGVPEFGRRIYHLAPPKINRELLPRSVTRFEATSIVRKAREPIQALELTGARPTWSSAFRAFRRRLIGATYGAVVLDYDGTLVDARHRFDPPTPAMCDEMVRLLRAGVHVGIATGRGGSVHRDLQSVLPSDTWPQVTIGYYNGADAGALDSDPPMGCATPTDNHLSRLARSLDRHPEIRLNSALTVRPHQLALTPTKPIGENEFWELVQATVLALGDSDVQVMRSSHSVDIIEAGTSKTATVQAIRAWLPKGEILAIGDRGAWPGNDHALLGEPHSLSADQSSLEPDSCWNLAPPGQRGVGAALHYLRSLATDSDGTARFVNGAFR